MRTEIRGKGDPIQLDYRLEKAGASWKIYDVNVLGVWLVENYRNSFAQEIGANGIDGLIAKLAERNKRPPAREELMLLLPATLTSREARVTLRMLQQALQSEGSEGPVVVEAGSLQQLDSAALGGAARDRAPGGGLGPRLRRARRPAKLAALAKLYGVDVLLLKPEPAAGTGAAALISAGRRRSRRPP